MTFEEYTKEVMCFAVYPDRGTGSLAALAYCGLSLGEAGEVQGKIKKLLRGDKPLTAETISEIAHELGDLLWYITATAEELGTSLNNVALRNMFKLQERAKKGTIKGDGDQR